MKSKIKASLLAGLFSTFFLLPAVATRLSVSECRVFIDFVFFNLNDL
jgi:hypothetical protein